MKKTLCAIACVVVFLGAPVVVPAVTDTNIQARIDALLSQIVDLKAKINLVMQNEAGATTSVKFQGTSQANNEPPSMCKNWYDGCNNCTRSSPGGPLVCTQRACIWNAGAKCEEYFDVNGERPRICNLPFKAISRGSSGDSVRAVQEFLKAKGLFSGETTAYFGIVTESALKNWQAQEGVVAEGSVYTTGWGALGKRTWESVQKYCGAVGKLSVSPRTGNAPLSVTFTANVTTSNSQFVADAGDFKIVFGDGSEERLMCTDTDGFCEGPHSIQHTYQTEGSYEATLIHYGFFGPAEQSVNGVLIGSTKVVVQKGVSNVCTKEYKPVCGQPVGCVNNCPPGMYCTMMCQLPEPQTYGNSCMLEASGATYLYAGECTSSNNNQAPVISGLSGPTTLGVNESGTWVVKASDPENRTLAYSVQWGDEARFQSDSTTASSPLYSQTSTFTHQYGVAGEYTITITVYDEKGASSKTSMSVNINGSPIACTLQYNPVCGQKGIARETYSNQCFMNAAGATLLYNGACY